MSQYRVIMDFSHVERAHEALLAELMDPDKVLRTAVMDLYAMISERIQNRGERTDGNPIGGGLGYSKQYKKVREAAGRQTDFIDFTFSGYTLDLSFIPGPTGPTSYGLIFLNDLAADRMELLEQRFGTVMQPSEEEEKQAFEHILNDIQDAINRFNF